MKWLLAALGTTFLWGLWGVAIKKAEIYSSTWYQVYVSSNLAILAVIAALAAVKGRAALPYNLEGFSWALAGGFAGTLGYILFILALEWSGRAGIVVPLTALYPAVTVVLAWLLLGEALTLRQLVGIVLAVVSIILLSG
ncbi:EamA family transporter [Stetteria hydrogenophila]